VQCGCAVGVLGGTGGFDKSFSDLPNLLRAMRGVAPCRFTKSEKNLVNPLTYVRLIYGYLFATKIQLFFFIKIKTHRTCIFCTGVVRFCFVE
jgi:hypothetical protein